MVVQNTVIKRMYILQFIVITIFFTDSSEESSNSSTTSSKSPPQLSPQNLSVTQNPIYVDLQPNHNGHKDSLLMMTSPQMALLTPQIKENHEMVQEVNNKYPNITVKVMSCGKFLSRLKYKPITYVKFGYSEKTTKFEKNLPLKI